MKFVIVIAGLLALPVIASAGVLGPLSLGAGASLNTPAGDFTDQAGPGWGLSAGAKLGIPVIDLTLIGEYLSFGEKDVTGGSRDAGMWGFAVGGRLALFPMVYGGVEVGSYSVTRTDNIGGQESEGKTTYGSYGPIVGVSVGGFDFNARYVVMDKAAFTSLRAMYWF
jgi:hypothetical protein